jgi:hypothetical protein
VEQVQRGDQQPSARQQANAHNRLQACGGFSPYRILLDRRGNLAVKIRQLGGKERNHAVQTVLNCRDHNGLLRQGV